MTTVAAAGSGARRRWDRFWLRLHARLDGEAADRLIPWIATVIVFWLHLALAAAAVRSSTAGGGLGPWLQAAWARDGNTVTDPVGGLDPARASASLVGEALLQATRLVPATVVFTVVQSAAIALAVVPLWRLARERAALRVGATATVVAAYALAPTVHQAGLTPFHPELVALPLLLLAWLQATRGAWIRYWVVVVAALACRGDIGITVAAMGLLVAAQQHRRHGLATAATGVAWSVAAQLVTDTHPPTEQLTPAGEFVARSVGPLAILPRIANDPLTQLGGLLTEPSIQFVVVVLAPLLFLPLVSFRRFAPALPGLALAMIADRAVADAAGTGVLDLAPIAAHIGPSIAFAFVALVFALERIGQRSVVRVNVDRRVLGALLCGTVLFFLVESPSAPYHRPWDWGGRGREVQVLEDLAERVPPGAALATSPSGTALVAERATLVELPPTPVDLTPSRLEALIRSVDWVLLDASVSDPVTGEGVWRPDDVTTVVRSLDRAGFTEVERTRQVILLRRG